VLLILGPEKRVLALSEDAEKRVPAPSADALLTFYDSWEWKRLRYKFIKRCRELGRWKCGACNRTQDHNAMLVPDHIKPIRWYWHLRLDQNNLQPLCKDCNMGKGSWDETDFRTPNTGSRLADTFWKTARTEIDSFVRDITFRGRKKVPEEDE
jgi:5-methylcytosine-specific restriction endonuclease McrA